MARRYSFAATQWKRIEDLLPAEPVTQECLKREKRGYDAGQRILGRKRHIAVDTMGLLLAGVFSRYSGPGRSQGLARAC